jgi:hypothetical protein
MNNKKFSVDDLPSLLEIDMMNKKQIELLSQKYPNPIEIYERQMAITQSFLFQNLDLIEEQDSNLIKNFLFKNLKLAVFSLLTSFFINVKIGTVFNGSFYKVPRVLRIFIRMSLFAAPIGLLSYNFQEPYLRISGSMTNKYMNKVEMYFKTGDRSFINNNFTADEENLQ